MLLTSVVCSGGIHPQDEQLEALKRHSLKARDYIEAGQLSEAIGVYTDVLESFTFSASIESTLYKNRGIVYSMLQSYSLALQDFDRSLEIVPQAYEVHAFRGRVLAQMGFSAKAAKAFTLAIQGSPEKPEWRLERAVQYLNQGRIHDAVQDVDSIPKSLRQSLSGRIVEIRLAIAEEQTAEALQRLESSLIAYPMNTDLQLLYVHQLYTAGQYEHAVTSADEFIERYPEVRKALHLKGLCLLKLDQNPEAIAVFDTLISEQPAPASYYADRSLAYIRLEKFALALSDVDKAIALDSSIQVAHFRRGLIYSSRGQYGTSLASFNRSIQLNPTHAESYHARGYLKDKEGFHAAALRDYELALSYRPNWDVVLCLQGRILVAKGKFPEALEAYDAALSENPTFSYAYFLKGRLYDRMGDYHKAFVLYEKSMELKAGDDARMSRAAIRRRFGDIAGASEDYLALANVKEYRFEALFNYAELLFDNREYEAAYTQCLVAADINPDSKKIKWLLARSAYKTDVFQTTVQETSWLIDQGEETTDLWALRGDALSQLDEVASAKSAYENALALFAGNGQAWLGIGKIQLAQGMDIEALKSLQHAEKLEPSKPDAVFAQANLLQKILLRGVYPHGADVVTTRAYEDALLERSERINEVLDLYKKAEQRGFNLNVLYGSRIAFYIEVRRLDAANKELRMWETLENYDKISHVKLSNRLKRVAGLLPN